MCSRHIKKSISIFTTLLMLFPSTVFANEAPNSETEVKVEQVSAINEIYPINVEETIENGYNIVVRTYALSPNENPNNIPRSDFSKYGEKYIFSEVVRKENSANNKLQHVETVTINTKSNNMESILSQLSPEMNYEKDGFQGILKLDISSVKTDVAGYKSNTSNLTTTREYPNLSNNDSSNIPKSVKQNGLNYNLVDIRFVSDSTTMIDYEEIPDTYKAIATYSATSTSKNVTGYITTANYTGEISKTLIDKVIYKVYFISEKPIGYVEEEIVIDDELNESENNLILNESNNKTKVKPSKEINKNIDVSSIMPFILIILSIIGIIGGIVGALVAIFYLSRQNTILIFNKHKGYYKKIGKVKLNLKKDQLIVDLNKFSKKIQSPYFVLELSKQLCKKLLKRPEDGIELIIRYKKDEIIQRIDLSDTNEIEEQFEVDFSDHDEDEEYVIDEA